MAVAEIINRAWFRYYRGFAVTSFTGPAIELQVFFCFRAFLLWRVSAAVAFLLTMGHYLRQPK